MDSMNLTDSDRAMLDEQERDAQPDVCWQCGGLGYIDNPADPGDVVPCDACAERSMLCDRCHAAPAEAMAGDTLLCRACLAEHGNRIWSRWYSAHPGSLRQQVEAVIATFDDDDFADVPFD